MSFSDQIEKFPGRTDGRTVFAIAENGMPIANFSVFAPVHELLGGARQSTLTDNSP